MQYRTHQVRPRHLLSIPFIYIIIFPLLLLDLFLELYHRVCFPLFGLPYVSRTAHIAIDRHRLTYLSLVERFHCAYCGYANGLLSYASAVAARTEEYWCAIAHERRTEHIMQPHHDNFVPYGDEEALEKRYPRTK